MSKEYRLRRMLANCYAGAQLYHGDGELQDNRMVPFIDFKRDSVGLIQSKMQERIIRNLRETGKP